MEFISELPLIGGFLTSAIGFIIVLGVVVFVHEYGHYIVGRWCGIGAETFSLGFGPKLYTRTDKRGTEWQVAALPLGGYVKFVGDADGSSRASPEAMDALSDDQRARSFHGAALWKRALTVAAGPFANFLLSILVFAMLVTFQGIAVDGPVVGEIKSLPGQEQTLRSGDRILSVNGEQIDEFGDIYQIAAAMDPAGPLALEIDRGGDRLSVQATYPLPPMVAAVEPLSAADAAGLRSGDFIRAADGIALQSFNDLRDTVLASGGKTLALDVIRDGAEITLSISPREVERLNPDGSIETRVMIGVGGDALYYPMTETPAPWSALWIGVERVIDIIDMSLTGLKHIIVGNLGADNLQGPLGIAQISGASAEQGAMDLITLIAVISTAIGMLNLFPIPVLDGGHLLMFGYEAVAGRPPADRVMRFAMTVGLSMVLLLMLFATYNDVMRLVTS